MVYPAAVTPFLEDGQVDKVSMTKLLAWYKANECDGVVVGGTTGEGPSLSVFEKRDLIRHTCEHSMGLPQVLGIATNSLGEAAWLCKQASEAGAEAVLVMAPAFFRDYGQRGLIDWFSRLLDLSEIPVMLYNFPIRTSIEIDAETVAKLAEHQNMAGLKDSSGNLDNIQDFAKAAPGKRLFVGDEMLLVEALENGWEGTISGSANVIGKWLKAICRDFGKDRESGQNKFDYVSNALAALRSAPQPLTHKEILKSLSIINHALVRTPLQADERAKGVWDSVAYLFP